MIDVSYVRQKEALGLGHAVLRAKELVGNEPFAAVLSDDMIASETPCIRQLLDVYEYYGASVLALMEVPKDQISAYGVVDAEPVADNGRQGRLSAFETWWKSRRLRTHLRTWPLLGAIF